MALLTTPSATIDRILEKNIQLDSVAQNGQSLDRQRDPNAILNECREIHEGIEAIERNLDAIRKLQQRALDDPNSSQQTSTNTELNMSSFVLRLTRKPRRTASGKFNLWIQVRP